MTEKDHSNQYKREELAAEPNYLGPMYDPSGNTYLELGRLHGNGDYVLSIFGRTGEKLVPIRFNEPTFGGGYFDFITEDLLLLMERSRGRVAEPFGDASRDRITSNITHAEEGTKDDKFELRVIDIEGFENDAMKRVQLLDLSIQKDGSVIVTLKNLNKKKDTKAMSVTFFPNGDYPLALDAFRRITQRAAEALKRLDDPKRYMDKVTRETDRAKKINSSHLSSTRSIRNPHSDILSLLQDDEHLDRLAKKHRDGTINKGNPKKT